ncbi:DUF2630 family protein [Arthrobacter sp. Br18]|uniref:DUF2630 family protein n=1 Tax=Arthrobacter sp. Br18 TaxID=1312954 RepID=UPI00047ED1CD|nr:DUF2630 family protein [Arthrobacter sp. Br18]
MNDQDILQRIQVLVKEEHDLRGGSPARDGGTDPEQKMRLKRVEEDLDQCWDLLRQRRAKADAGGNPAEADPRPISQVEGYRQ